jgi:hypothetical protein
MMRERRGAFTFFRLAIAIFLVVPTFGHMGPAHAESKSVEFTLNDSQFGYWLESKLYGFTFKTGSTDIDQRLTCSSWDDPSCSKADQLLGELIMRPCNGSADRGCIEAVAVGNAKSKAPENMKRLKLFAESPSKTVPPYRFLGSSSGTYFDVPGGGGVSIWESDTKDNTGAPKRYMAHVLTRYSYFCGDLKRFVGDFTIAGDRTCAIGTIEFKGSIIPVTLTEKSNSCTFFALQDKCIEPANYSGDERVSLTLRQDKNRTGWLFGRMSDSTFGLTTLDAAFNKVQIEGNVVFVPALKAVVEKSEISRYPKLENFLKARFNGLNGASTYQQFLDDPRTVIDRQIYDGWEIFDAFEENLKPIKTTASNNGVYTSPATNSILWNFASAVFDGSNLHPCSADKSKLHGLVVTNAPLYSSGPPAFQAGSLDYKVAGAHLNEDGSLFKGQYTFVVRSDTARCYYGFSSAPVEAKVSVVYSAGAEQVATTAVNEKGGFLTLAANGFTFSSPTIRVALTQPKKTLPNTKISITCKKGKKVVKLTVNSTSSAKCPKGYAKI